MASVEETLSAITGNVDVSTPVSLTWGIVTDVQPETADQNGWVEVGLPGDQSSIRCPQRISGPVLETEDQVILAKVSGTSWVVVGKMEFIRPAEEERTAPIELLRSPRPIWAADVPSSTYQVNPPDSDSGFWILVGNQTVVEGVRTFNIVWYSHAQLLRLLIPYQSTPPAARFAGALWLDTSA